MKSRSHSRDQKKSNSIEKTRSLRNQTAKFKGKGEITSSFDLNEPPTAKTGDESIKGKKRYSFYDMSEKQRDSYRDPIKKLKLRRVEYRMDGILY